MNNNQTYESQAAAYFSQRYLRWSLIALLLVIAFACSPDRLPKDLSTAAHYVRKESQIVFRSLSTDNPHA